MGKYKFRYLIAVGVLLVLPAFTCGVGPVLRDLLQRVEVLETESELITGKVGALEADVYLLREEIDALAAEFDATPIVVDGTGKVLGPVIGVVAGGPAAYPWVQLDLPVLPLFGVAVTPQTIFPIPGRVVFKSGNCTGQPWTEVEPAVWGHVIALLDSPTGRTFYVSDPSDVLEPIGVNSILKDYGVCDTDDFQTQGVRLTPVDLDAIFTPPFRVTTRGRMQAQP